MWLAYANDKEVLCRVAGDAYCIAYSALVSACARLPKPIQSSDAIVVLHLAYGWMPTIPRLDLAFRSLNTGEPYDVLRTLELARGVSPADPGYATQARDCMMAIRAFSNESLVGASKILHFLNPEIFPIWDSRTAKIFLGRRCRTASHLTSDLKLWKIYFDALHDWRQHNDVSQRCIQLRELIPALSKVTDLRLIELVVFHVKMSA